MIKSGISLDKAKKAIVIVHGRGASADSMLSISRLLTLTDTAVLLPEVATRTWYPYSFMAPADQNQPELDHSLQILDDAVNEITDSGMKSDQIYFLGFSQGACLVLEYVTRNAKKYAGVIAFTGGLIGETLAMENYKGDFQGTPFLLTTGDPDPHVPLTRVLESVELLKGLNGNVQSKVYKGRPHTINEEEIELANELLSK